MFQQNLMAAGPVIYPLLLCSLVAVMLLIERVISLCRYPACISMSSVQGFKSGRMDQTDSLEKSKAVAGLHLLNDHRHFSKALRDEVLSQWLEQQRQLLHARIRWLTIIGAVAPLLGLLGTVLGIIDMFQDVSHQTGPITPAILASGMWEAMATTALGLMIAIPTIAISQAFGIWSDSRIERISSVLNQCSLWLETEWESGAVANAVKPTLEDVSAA